MIRLVKTSRFGKSGHYHWILFDDEDLSGNFIVISEIKGHRHQATIQQIPGLIKIDLSLISITEDSEKDGKVHSHIVTDEEITKTDSIEIKIEALSDNELCGIAKTLVSSSIDREQNSKTSGDISEKFVYGEQWIDDNGATLAILDENKSRITVNIVKAYLNLLFGHHRQNRTDIKYAPVEESDPLIADILTAVSKIELTNNNFEFNENQVVEDMSYTGRGNLLGYVDRDKNVQGDIKINRIPWRQAYYGEHNGYAAEDADYCFIATYLSKAEIMAKWNIDEEKSELGASLGSLAESFERSMKNDIVAKDGLFLKDAYDIESKKYRIVELWKKEYSGIYSIINEDGSFFATRDKKFTDLAQFESLGFKQIRRKKEYIRHQVFASESILLLDEIADIDMLPMVPSYYEKCGDKWFGKVENTIPLQRLFNVLVSKIMDFVTKSVNDVMLYDKDSLPEHGSMAEEKTFKKELSMPSAAIEVSDLSGGHVPQRLQNSQLPPYMIQLLEDIKITMQTILNLNPGFTGQAPVQSGIAIMQMKQQAIMGNEKFFDNLALSKKYLGRLFLKLFKECYTVDRILRIIENNDAIGTEFRFAPDRINSSGKFTPEERQEIAQRISTADWDKYDCIPTQSPYNPTTLMANFLLVWEANQSGQFPLPPEALIELNPNIDFKTKQKVLGIIKQYQEQQQAQQQNMQASEQNKAMIAAQSRKEVEQMKMLQKNPEMAMMGQDV